MSHFYSCSFCRQVYASRFWAEEHEKECPKRSQPKISVQENIAAQDFESSQPKNHISNYLIRLGKEMVNHRSDEDIYLLEKEVLAVQSQLEEQVKSVFADIACKSALINTDGSAKARARLQCLRDRAIAGAKGLNWGVNLSQPIITNEEQGVYSCKYCSMLWWASSVRDEHETICFKKHKRCKCGFHEVPYGPKFYTHNSSSIHYLDRPCRVSHTELIERLEKRVKALELETNSPDGE